MDFSETPEHTMLRAAVADLAGGFGHEYFAGKVRSGGSTDELWQALADYGYLGVNLPEAHGGGGGGIAELAIVCEEVAAAGCPLLLVLVSAAICAELIARFGNDGQQQRWLPQLAGGTKMAFAITEPDAGSNSHNLTTVATRDGDVFRIRGTKTFISGVDEAAAMLVVVRTGTDDTTGRARLSLLIVDTDAPGLDRSPIETEVGVPERQFVLFFDDVEVSADRLLGDVDEGMRVLFHGLNPERIMSAALCNGVGRYALARAATYANERVVWGTPIGSHQGVAHPLAMSKIALEQARLMTAKAAWMHDRCPGSREAGEAANIAKFASAEAGMQCLDTAIQTHGGNGMTTEYGLADLWGVVRLLRIAPVSREMVLNFVAQQSLGLARSY